MIFHARFFFSVKRMGFRFCVNLVSITQMFVRWLISLAKLNEVHCLGPNNWINQSSLWQIKGFPDRIGTKQELCDIVTRIISQLTIQHAAVNYPLSDYGLYIPNLPTKLYNDTRVKEGSFNYSRLPNGKTSAVSMNLFWTVAERWSNVQDWTKLRKLRNLR